MYLSIFGLWMAAGLAITMTPGVSLRTARGFIDAGYILLPLMGAIATTRRAFLRKDIRRYGWAIFTLAFLNWSAAGVLWAYHEIFLGRTPPYPSLADIGFVGFGILSAIGLAVLMRQWSPRLTLHEVLDVLFIGFATAFTIYTVVLDEAFGATEAEGWTLVATLAYPAADVAVLTVALFTLSRAPQDRRVQPLLLAGGLGLLAITDTVWIYMTALGTYRSGGPFDLLWHLAFGVVICGVIYRQADARASVRNREATNVWTPTVMAGVVVAAIIYEEAVHGGLDLVATLLALALFALLVARQTLALQHNERLRAEVQAANDRLKEAAAFRTQFINATAHELSNPLTPLKIHALLLTEPAYAESAENRAATAAILGRSIERLIRLVDDLLDLARIEAGRVSLRADATDACRIARETVQLFEAAAQAKNVRLQVEGPPQMPLVTDPQRVGQVLGNFVSNAIKYSTDGKTVLVRILEDGQAVRMEVKDEGVGLSRQQQAQLFRPFSQVHGKTEQQRGTGLGLYICATLAARLGGEVGVHSEGSGRGSTFWMRLPRALPSPEA